MPQIDNAWIALAGTLLGGAGFKILEAFLGRSKTRDDTQANMRTELRGEVVGLRQEVDRLKNESRDLQHELDTWRDKYYSIVAAAAQGDMDTLKQLFKLTK